MTRPKRPCKIEFCPKFFEFNPKGQNEDCHCIELTREETEALRLKNIKGLDQTAAAKQMGISQSTFQRILSSAYRKMSEAIVYGKIIKIKKWTIQNSPRASK